MESLEARRLLAREVSGTLAADEDWSGTIHVQSDVIVPEGVQLTIQPGTVVKFATGQFLAVNGSIDAQGTSQSPIVMTSVRDDSVGEDLTDGVDGTPFRVRGRRSTCVGRATVSPMFRSVNGGDTNGDGVGAGGTASLQVDFDGSELQSKPSLRAFRSRTPLKTAFMSWPGSRH